MWFHLIRLMRRITLGHSTNPKANQETELVESAYIEIYREIPTDFSLWACWRACVIELILAGGFFCVLSFVGRFVLHTTRDGLNVTKGRSGRKQWKSEVSKRDNYQRKLFILIISSGISPFFDSESIGFQNQSDQTQWSDINIPS